VDSYRERVPASWVERGGIFLPMYQAEALWLSFSGTFDEERQTNYPIALKIGAGMRSAVTGEAWTNELRAKDYVTIPEQPWLDGFTVEKGTIRQFVAAPLGMGFTVEAQLTGKETFGGIQIEAYPMKREVFEKKFPIVPEDRRYRGRGIRSLESMGGALECMSFAAAAPAADMGLAAGGKMKQQVFDDPHGLDVWDLSAKERCFVSLANSLAWEIITGEPAPSTPASADYYRQRGYPWFDYYREDLKALEGTPLLANLKGLKELGFQKGMHLAADIAKSIEIPKEQIRDLSPKPVPAPGVRDGKWLADPGRGAFPVSGKAPLLLSEGAHARAKRDPHTRHAHRRSRPDRRPDRDAGPARLPRRPQGRVAGRSRLVRRRPRGRRVLGEARRRERGGLRLARVRAGREPAKDPLRSGPSGGAMRESTFRRACASRGLTIGKTYKRGDEVIYFGHGGRREPTLGRPAVRVRPGENRFRKVARPESVTFSITYEPSKKRYWLSVNLPFERMVCRYPTTLAGVVQALDEVLSAGPEAKDGVDPFRGESFSEYLRRFQLQWNSRPLPERDVI
jgi:hypothetical protein